MIHKEESLEGNEEASCVEKSESVQKKEKSKKPSSKITLAVICALTLAFGCLAMIPANDEWRPPFADVWEKQGLIPEIHRQVTPSEIEQKLVINIFERLRGFTPKYSVLDSILCEFSKFIFIIFYGCLMITVSIMKLFLSIPMIFGAYFMPFYWHLINQ